MSTPDHLALKGRERQGNMRLGGGSCNARFAERRGLPRRSIRGQIFSCWLWVLGSAIVEERAANQPAAYMADSAQGETCWGIETAWNGEGDYAALYLAAIGRQQKTHLRANTQVGR